MNHWSWQFCLMEMNKTSMVLIVNLLRYDNILIRPLSITFYILWSVEIQIAIYELFYGQNGSYSYSTHAPDGRWAIDM